METQIKAVCPTKRGLVPVNIFAYTSAGLPGLEIVGPGKGLRAIKEKFIYLTRVKKLKLPLRRYVVCIEFPDLEGQLGFDENDLLWLEFPMLLVFWCLCGFLPIYKLNNCLAAGRVLSNGRIINLDLDIEVIQKIADDLCSSGVERISYIYDGDLDPHTFNDERIKVLPAQELLDDLNYKVPQTFQELGHAALIDMKKDFQMERVLASSR